MKHIATVVVFATLFAMGTVPKAQANENEACSNATLHGSFGYTSTGTLLDTFVPPPFAGPFAEVGKQTFDGKGKTEATATISSNGNINQAVAIDGTYAVNSDCTGSMTLNIPAFGATVHADFVIDRDAEEIRAIVTEAGVVESRVYRKQFREGREETAGLTPGACHLLTGPSSTCSDAPHAYFPTVPGARVFRLQDGNLLTASFPEGAVARTHAWRVTLPCLITRGTGRFKPRANAADLGERHRMTTESWPTWPTLRLRGLVHEGGIVACSDWD